MGNDDARRILLARRARFIAAALASVAATGTTIVVGAEGCGGDAEQQTDAGQPPPGPCLTAPREDSGAQDSGVEDSGTDAEPQACLKVAPDAGKDAEPQPCLTPPIDGG